MGRLGRSLARSGIDAEPGGWNAGVAAGGNLGPRDTTFCNPGRQQTPASPLSACVAETQVWHGVCLYRGESLRRESLSRMEVQLCFGQFS